MSCESCLSVSLPQCPPHLFVKGGLEANTTYRWEITDKFQHVFNGLSETDATGLLAINIQDNPDIPKGAFMSFSGSFILKAYKYINIHEIENAQFAVDSINYDCAELMFKDYRPAISYFDPLAPIYIPPFTEQINVEFTDQTEIVVFHEYGFHPFVWIEDTPGHVIEGHVVHDSIDQFTVSFDSNTSGIIHYR